MTPAPPSERPLPPVEGVEHRWVSAGGLRMHVAEAGSGPPLVMLHGWPQHWWMWRHLVAELAPSHRVICPDLRGFGWSAAPPGGYAPEVFARDVAALIEALGIEEPVDLVGHDWGGFTGFLLCLRRPELVRRLLALNILHPFGAPSLAGVVNAWRFWYQLPIAAPAIFPRALGPFAGRIGPALAWVGGREAGWSAEEHEQYTAQFRERDRALAGAQLYRHSALELLPSVIRGAYRQMTMPTPGLILFGTADRVQHPSLVPGYERNAPAMRHELVPGAGHFIVEQRPELVAERAGELFAR